MRSIRNAAVAGVTALAVSLSGVAFAAGETPNNDTNNASLSSKYSKEYEGDKAVTGALSLIHI